MASAIFSADGLRVVATGLDYGAYIWDLGCPGAETAPAGWDRLAEAIGSVRIHPETGIREWVGPEIWLTLRETLRAQDGTTGDERLAAWFTGDPWRRTITPFSQVTAPEYIRGLLVRGRPEAVAELKRFFPGHPLVLAGLAMLEGDDEQTAVWAQSAERGGGDFPFVFYYLAALRQRAGDSDGYRMMMQRGLSLEPDQQTRERRLDALEGHFRDLYAAQQQLADLDSTR